MKGGFFFEGDAAVKEKADCKGYHIPENRGGVLLHKVTGNCREKGVIKGVYKTENAELNKLFA